MRHEDWSAIGWLVFFAACCHVHGEWVVGGVVAIIAVIEIARAFGRAPDVEQGEIEDE